MNEENLFFSSPYPLAADSKSATYWAGRADVLKRVEKIMRGLQRRPDSTLDIVWANFGAGKSHTLYFLSNTLSKSDSNVSVVVEVPEQIKNFLDVYKRLIRQLPFDKVAEAIVSAREGLDADNVSRAARVISHGAPTERDVAIQWLCAERPHLKELRNLTGITSRIETDAAAVDTLSTVISALSSQGIRLCLMLDEFQRIGKLPERIRSHVTSNLRSLLSQNPQNLSMFFAISSRIEKTALTLIPQELKTMMGIKPLITLPEFGVDEAMNFIQERFENFRQEGYSGSVFAPFSEAQVRQAVSFIAELESASLIPRTILHALVYLSDEIVDDEDEFSREGAVAECLSALDWKRLTNGNV